VKKLLTTVALLSAMFAASPALSDDVDPRAYAFVLTTAYDGFCAKLPPLLMAGITAALEDMPEPVFKAAFQKVHDEHVKLGFGFCAHFKPLIDERVAATAPKENQ
jgi:hypothetical protein